MTHIVEFLDWQTKTVFVPNENVFALNPKKKMLWLQKLCIAILRKLGCQWQEPTAKVTRHTINTDDFMRRLYAQRSSLVRHFNREASVLLIGVEDFEELMGTSAISHEFSFSAQYHHASDRGVRVMGLEVKVIPWMRGAVVMPKN